MSDYLVLAETFRVAAKPHACVWCPEPIAAGERHHSQVQKFDGRVETVRMHEDCNSAFVRVEARTRAHRVDDEPVCWRSTHRRGAECDEECI